jgi:phage terminase large subunit
MSEILKVHEKVNTTLKHRSFFQCDDRIVLFYGSAGSGKSFSICDKILIRTGTEEKLKIIVARK